MNIRNCIRTLNFAVLCLVCSNLSGQSQPVIDAQYPKKIYLGVGGGLDYGGLGGKFEFFPIKHFGVYVGAGYNLLSLGWNIGGTLKILPDKKVSPNLMFMYGYNSVTIDRFHLMKENEKVFYGVSVGGNVDFKIGRKNKISAGLFYPFRSSEFKEITRDVWVWPLGGSVGFNFGF